MRSIIVFLNRIVRAVQLVYEGIDSFHAGCVGMHVTLEDHMFSQIHKFPTLSNLRALDLLAQWIRESSMVKPPLSNAGFCCSLKVYIVICLRQMTT